jgi:hypothetical protein
MVFAAGSMALTTPVAEATGATTVVAAGGALAAVVADAAEFALLLGEEQALSRAAVNSRF